MNPRFQNWIISIFLALLLLPFVLLQDFYPFYRFGMFAEPVKYSIQTEQFYIIAIHTDSSTNLLNPNAINIGHGTYSALLRNYYYREESEQLLKNIAHLYRNSSLCALKLMRIEKDTALVYHWKK